MEGRVGLPNAVSDWNDAWTIERSGGTKLYDRKIRSDQLGIDETVEPLTTFVKITLTFLV